MRRFEIPHTCRVVVIEAGLTSRRRHSRVLHGHGGRNEKERKGATVDVFEVIAEHMTQSHPFEFVMDLTSLSTGANGEGVTNRGNLFP